MIFILCHFCADTIKGKTLLLLIALAEAVEEDTQAAVDSAQFGARSIHDSCRE